MYPALPRPRLHGSVGHVAGTRGSNQRDCFGRPVATA